MDTHTNTTRATQSPDKLCEVLLQKKLLTQNELIRLQEKAHHFGQTLFQHIMQYRVIDPKKFQVCCAEYFAVAPIIIDSEKISPVYWHTECEDKLLLPIIEKENHLIIAFANPDDIDNAKKLSFHFGLPVTLQIAQYDNLLTLHNAYFSEKQYETLKQNHDNTAKTITYQILSDAIHRNASDIHLEPHQHYFCIRFRIDGLLHDILHLVLHFAQTITSCIKALSNMDIATKRLPQDGRTTFYSYLGFFKDCRVSTCPTAFGEKTVIRLLDTNTQIRPIESLGLNIQDQKIIVQTLTKPQGLILVTGPTGSGKTITLYTLLQLLNQRQRNIVTIEDPIEITLNGINQSQVNHKSALSFANILRALLRQDPDIIMIGEIRDQETAEMAIRAAQTGHLVLSTLHTNNAAEAITRLMQMGIKPFHLTAALTLIIAQRLIRKLCCSCKKPSLHYFEPVGCSHCHLGFLGRTGVFELMPIQTEQKEMILDNASSLALTQRNKKSGQFTLWESGMEAVEHGMTSLCEIYRTIPQE